MKVNTSEIQRALHNSLCNVKAKELIKTKGKEKEKEMLRSLKSLKENVSKKISSFFTQSIGINHKKVKIFLYNLTKSKHPDGDAIIAKRGDELKELFSVIGKRKYRNIIILGESGTGRHQLIEGIAQSIITGNCPNRFKNSLMFEVPVEQFSTELGKPDEISARINTLVHIAKKYPNTIFYFDNFEKLYYYQVIDYFQMVFDNAICISVMTHDEATKIDLFQYHFLSFFVENPKRADLYDLVKGSINVIERFHHVIITKGSFEKILDEVLATTYVTNIADVLDIADEAASIAENRGLEEVDIRSILETNRFNIDEMLKRGKKLNTFYAMHEAGHAIVALHYNVGVEAISIIPRDDGQTGGFNLFEPNKNSLDSKDDTLKQIEIALGGYAATLYKGYPLTYGASSDLMQVSKIARAMFLYLGLEEENPISYLNDMGQLELTYMSDTMKDELNKKVSNIISDSVSKAKKVIKKEENKFNLIASALEKKGFLTKNEALALYNGEMALDDIPSIYEITF